MDKLINSVTYFEFMDSEIYFDLVFDNSDVITLQTAQYCHHFKGREQELAGRVAELLAGGNASLWDNNEPEHRRKYDCEEERRGDYEWVNADTVIHILTRPDWRQINIDTGDFARDAFFSALLALWDKHRLTFASPSFRYVPARSKHD